MGKINVLSFAVANLIAAGEVVDRPASVIKELMENAIDAGATRVTVEIQNGGVTFMRVSDNGCGMSPEDLPVAIRRHATSKIKDASDLEGILTLGFRGEALAAIASVSDIRIISKTADAPFGAVLEAHGGEQITVTEQGCSTGTSVIVENLFANVPARRKFLKKDVTETMAVTANVEKIALSNPQIAFRLVVDGNVRLETAGDGSLKSTVYALFGKEFANRLIEVSGENEGIELRGFIGRTDNYKANRNYQNFFVNGRFVKSKTAMAALEQAYTSYMPPEKFPCCVLFIDVNPARVDVNVHPAKLEVKFSNEKAIFEAVYYTVRSALESNVTRPVMNLDSGLRRSKLVSPGARLSDSAAPVDNERPESLRSRQLSYDLTGGTQPQPQERMTAEEFRRMMEPAETAGKRKSVAQSPCIPALQGSAPSAAVPKVGTSQSAGALSVSAPSGTKAAMPERPTPQTAESSAEPERRGTSSVPDSWEIPQNTTAEPPGSTEAPKDVHPAPSVPASVPAAVATDSVGAPTVPAGSPMQKEAPAAAETAPVPTAQPSGSPQVLGSPLSYRLVGEVFHAYILVELEDKMLIVDQHAAHERILFEQLKANLREMEACSQMLMIPLDTMMTTAEVEALRQYDSELGKIGFSLRYARNTVSADAIPEGVETSAVSDMLQTMAGRILDNTGSVKLTRDIIFEKALYQAACKAAIKAGREYAPGHVEWLIKKLMALPDITFCPHGRPVAMELTKRTLDRQFDRTGF